MKLRSSLFATAVLASATSFFAGCPCPGLSPFVGWHFENDCSDDLCGFAVASGQATRVSAIAPGEHALLLAPGTAIDQTLTESLGTAGSTPLSLTLIARCENGAQLSATITLSEVRTSDGGSAIPNIVTLTNSITPTADWQQRIIPLARSSQTTGTATTTILAGVHIQNDSAGRCWIDDVGVARNTFCE